MNNFITNSKANIQFRFMSCVAACPYCHQESIIEMDEYIGVEEASIDCPECENEFTISVFDYFAQYN